MATEFITTIRTSGSGDFNLLSTWEAAMQNDLTAATIKVFSHGGKTGTLAAGNTVTGQTSGATATVVFCTGTQILLKSIASGPFVSGEIVRVSSGNEVTISDTGDSPICVAECYDDWPGGLSDDLVVNGWTTDTTRYVVVKAASGHSHGGIPGAGFLISKDSPLYTGPVYINQNNVRLIGLDVINTRTSADCISIWPRGTGILIKDCLAKSLGTSGGSGYSSSFWDYNSAVTFEGCMAYGSTLNGFLFNSSSNVSNCVAVNSGTGFKRSAGTPLLNNCVAYNNTTNYTGTFSASSTNNASSSASGAPGSSPVHSVTSAAFVNAASNDFHLASGSVLIGAGTNLYSTFTTDIDGDTWPSSGAWDIGFDYRVASGGAQTLTPSLFSNTNTFYSPTVSQGAVTLTPALFSNTSTFYSPTVSQGAVTLTPALFSNTNTFYSPVITQEGGIQYLVPNLFSNTSTFYSSTVSTGPVTLAPELFTNSGAFYAATVAPGAITLTPALFANATTFYASTVSLGFAPQVLQPELVSSTNQFFTCIVTTGGVTLTPSLFVNTNTFYPALIPAGTAFARTVRGVRVLQSVDIQRVMQSPGDVIVSQSTNGVRV